MYSAEKGRASWVGHGSRAVTFRTTRANTVVLVTYNAECVATGYPGSYVSIVITIDGIDATPQIGNDFAFCSPVDRMLLVPIAASRQVVVSNLPPQPESVEPQTAQCDDLPLSGA